MIRIKKPWLAPSPRPLTAFYTCIMPSDNATTIAANMAADFEGFSSTPYKDPVGIWTIGYGSIWDWSQGPDIRVTSHTTPIDEARAKIWLGYELAKGAFVIKNAVKVPLTDDEDAALLDFIYNLGQGNFLSSTLLKLLNAGDYEKAAQQLLLWDHAGGKVLAGLLRRRQAEMSLFNS